MNSYTTEQLLMCEKADLVKYIEELKYDKSSVCETLATAVASRLSSWMPDELMEGVDFAEDVDMSKVDGDAIVKMIDGYTKCCIKNETEELKKWSLSEDMIESTSAETIEEFEKDVRDNWKELEELRSSIESISNEYMSGEETIDDIRDYIEQKTDEIVELREENEELKEKEEKNKLYFDHVLHHEKIYRERSEKLNKEIKSLKSFRNHYKSSYEDEKRKTDELKKCNTYYRCYLSYADPKGYGEPDKEHIDKFAGDDEELKKSLYEEFDIEEEEEDTYLDGKKIVDTGSEIHGHN